MAQEPDVVSQKLSSYCREIETYLCRKNGGHLIRIVGPAFEEVCAWAGRGVPLKIAFRGIDRCCERHQAKGSRRRPIRIEFCEADILDAFDEWRRAVGVRALDGESEADSHDVAARKRALAGHIERAVTRLRSPNASTTQSETFRNAMRAAAQELETMAAPARAARGENRDRITKRLAALDLQLLATAIDEISPAQTADLKREAEMELAPFAPRMAPAERERALTGAFHRLVRETLGVPILIYE